MKQENQEQIKATGAAKWLAGLALSVILLVAYELELFLRDTRAFARAVACVVCVIPVCIWNLVHVKYLTPEGVEIIRFGRIARFLSWKQTAQVCVAREAWRRHHTQLLITPVECEAYDPKRWSGWRYALRFCRQVITIDDTEKNRQFIAAHYGEISDKRDS